MKRTRLTTLLLLATLALTACAKSGPPRPDGPNLLEISRIPEAHATARGAGVTIAIVDWQFDTKGREAKKYVHPISMVPGEPIGELDPWHGEWMAEIAHLVAPDAKIIPIKARGLEHPDIEPFVLEGLRYAAEHGAVAVSSSMGTLPDSPELRAVIDELEAKGTLFVNVHPELVPGEDGKPRLCQPDECDPRILHTGIVSVPAHPTRPHPSRDVYTGAYDLESHWEDGWGFSNAPPTVLGVIALLKERNPELTPADMRRILRESAREENGFAVLDASAALEVAAARATSPAS